MHQHKNINVIFYYPKCEEDIAALGRRVAEIHADTVNARIKDLNCPTSQKLQLLAAVIATVRHETAH